MSTDFVLTITPIVIKIKLMKYSGVPNKRRVLINKGVGGGGGGGG